MSDSVVRDINKVNFISKAMLKTKSRHIKYITQSILSYKEMLINFASYKKIERGLSRALAVITSLLLSSMSV